MKEITYTSVEPLLANAKLDVSSELSCTFTCPLTGADHVGVGELKSGRTLKDVSTVDRSLIESVKLSLASLLRRTLTSPSTRGKAGAEVLAMAGAGSPYTTSELQAGVVLAFRSVAKRFVWDDKAERWIAAEGASELLTPFARQLGVAPVTQEIDKELLSRMLTEVARADGRVTPTEWAFLGEFIPSDMRSVDDTMEQPALTDEELNTASLGACRDTMLMLAFGLAFTDTDLDHDESAQLTAYARGLRVPEARALELRGYAQLHMFEDALDSAYSKGKCIAKRQREAHALARRIGICEEDATQAEANFKRRRGVE